MSDSGNIIFMVLDLIEGGDFSPSQGSVNVPHGSIRWLDDASYFLFEMLNITDVSVHKQFLGFGVSIVSIWE